MDERRLESRIAAIEDKLGIEHPTVQWGFFWDRLTAGGCPTIGQIDGKDAKGYMEVGGCHWK